MYKNKYIPNAVTSDIENETSSEEVVTEITNVKTGDVETVIVEKWRCVEIGQKAGEEEKDNINIFSVSNQ